MTIRMQGVVKFFHATKGYGFIRREDGQGEVFVHVSALPEDAEIGDGDKVSFELIEGKRGKGLAAVRLQLEG